MANGARGGTTNSSGPGAGGGGRIALVYNPSVQAAVTPKPSLTISAAGGAPDHQGNFFGALGTVYLSDDKLLPAWVGPDFNGILHGVTTWSVPGDLVVSNGYVTFAGLDGSLTVASNLTIIERNAGRLYRPALALRNLDVGKDMRVDNRPLTFNGGVSGAIAHVSGSFTITNRVAFNVYGGTNGMVGTNYSALVEVGGALRIYNSTSYPWSYRPALSNASPLFRVGSFLLASSGVVKADLTGYFPAGAGNAGATNPSVGARFGGSYGGQGGAGDAVAATPYGSSNMPVDAGSTAGDQSDPYADSSIGGGLVRIEAPDGTVRVDGLITADGGDGAQDEGGGSGGGVFIIARTFTGAPSGGIRARGGTVSVGSVGSGGGGGGRIAIWSTVNTFAGSLAWPMSVTNGAGGGTSPSVRDGTPGTLVFIHLPVRGSVIGFR
jgi:hypothetical protein